MPAEDIGAGKGAVSGTAKWGSTGEVIPISYNPHSCILPLCLCRSAALSPFLLWPNACCYSNRFLKQSSLQINSSLAQITNSQPVELDATQDTITSVVLVALILLLTTFATGYFNRACNLLSPFREQLMCFHSLLQFSTQKWFKRKTTKTKYGSELWLSTENIK